MLMKQCYFYQSCRFQSVTLLKVSFLHGCFSHFSNCTNRTKFSLSQNHPLVLFEFEKGVSINLVNGLSSIRVTRNFLKLQNMLFQKD